MWVFRVRRSSCRDWAAGDVWAGDIAKRLGKEILVAILNGVAVATVLGSFIPGLSTVIDIHAPGQLSLTSGLSLSAVILLAALIGATVLLLVRCLRTRRSIVGLIAGAPGGTSSRQPPGWNSVWPTPFSTKD